MEQAAVATADSRRRTSVTTAAIALALVVVSIVFAASAPWYFVFKMLHVGAAVVWVGGGLFITIITDPEVRPGIERAAAGARARVGRDRRRAALPGHVVRRPRLRDRNDHERGHRL